MKMKKKLYTLNVLHNIQGTEEQDEIWNEIAHGDSHVMVYAGAGTGKTFTIVQSAKSVNGSKGFLAFNKAIATELGTKLPSDCEAMTFHSLGFSAIKMQSRVSKVDNKKVYKIINSVLGKYKSAPALVKLVSLSKSSLVDASDKESLLSLIDEYDIEFDGLEDRSTALDYFPTIINNCMDLSTVDFDDMIWLPVVMDLPVRHYDTLFVDEAQDFNEVQRKLILKSCNGGRMIVVGDPKQAIYGFRGADSASMDMFHKTLSDSPRKVKVFELSITWRCPKTVVAEANRFFKGYTCREDAPEGMVNSNADFNPSVGDLVLCRVNAPLVGECFNLIAQGIPAFVLGRDIGYSLQLLIKKVTENGSMRIEQFIPQLNAHVEVACEAFRRADKENAVVSMQDKAQCILHLTGNTSTVQGLLDNIKKIFGDGKKRGVIFSTIHKAKGLEADNVWILKPEVMPHPMAKSLSAKAQERNLCYVAITRAKKTLNYVGERVGA